MKSFPGSLFSATLITREKYIVIHTIYGGAIITFAYLKGVDV